MSIMSEKALMNLPTDVRLLLSTGRSSLYRLPKKYSKEGAYLLAISRDATFFIHEDGVIGKPAGKLGEIEVEEVVRIPSTGSSTTYFKAAR